MRAFMASPAGAGIVLIGVTVLALIVANSALAPTYFDVLGAHVLGLSVLHWINDALMAVFFLLVGLEIKRELMVGELRTWADRALPGIAAVGGMAVPALVYVGINLSTPETLRGWAIPSATDIALALGVLALLGSRVPASLKVFLTALAILDDLGAVLIIAAVYTTNLAWPYLLGAFAMLGCLHVLGRRGVEVLWPCLALGVVLWFLVLKSGVHATLAGVALAAMIPIRPRADDETGVESPLLRLEHALQPGVAYVIVPLFGFANAGVSFAGLTAASLMQAVPLGIAAGLLIGKQVGICLFSWAAIRFDVARLPASASWLQFYGVALLCGIGFTMSLFIGLLAFPASPELIDGVKTGVIAGSLLSALAGVTVLLLAGSRSKADS